MNYPDLIDILLFIAKEHRGKNLRVVLMGSGLLEIPEYVYSSPQAIELLAALTYQRHGALDLTIIDRSQQVLDATKFPGRYVTREATRYSEQMRLALLGMVGNPLRHEAVLVFDAYLPKDTTIDRVNANFEDLHYGEDEIDLIVATTCLNYAVTGDRVIFSSGLIKALKPGGSLLVNFASLCLIIPELGLLIPRYGDIGGITQGNREKAAQIVSNFEQLLHEKFGILIEIKFYGKMAVITKLSCDQQSQKVADIILRYYVGIGDKDGHNKHLVFTQTPVAEQIVAEPSGKPANISGSL